MLYPPPLIAPSLPTFPTPLFGVGLINLHQTIYAITVDAAAQPTDLFRYRWDSSWLSIHYSTLHCWIQPRCCPFGSFLAVHSQPWYCPFGSSLGWPSTQSIPETFASWSLHTLSQQILSKKLAVFSGIVAAPTWSHEVSGLGTWPDNWFTPSRGVWCQYLLLQGSQDISNPAYQQYVSW